MVSWLMVVGNGAKGHRFESCLFQSKTKKIISPAVNKYFFSNQGKIKVAKGEGLDPPFVCCAQDILGLKHPLPQWPLAYWNLDLFCLI